MRILNVNMSLDPKNGGTAERTLQMTRYLVLAGHDARIVTTDKGLTPERIQAIPGRVTAFPCLWDRFFVPKMDWAVLRREISQADIVHIMGHWTLLNAWVYKTARQLGKPYVFCPAGALVFFGRSKGLKRMYQKVWGQGMLEHALGNIATTEREISDFVREGVSKDRIQVIPNAVDPDDYQDQDVAAFRERFGLGSDPYILFLGRMSPIKGPDLMIESFARIKDRLPRLQLVMAGPDDENHLIPTLKAQAEREGIADRVHFIGLISGADKSRALHGAEILAVPSRSEVMSMVAIEAGMVSRPVLTTDRCGFDHLEEIRGGRVVPVNSEALAQGLQSLLIDSSAEDRRRMGENLRAYCLKFHSWQGVVRQYIEYYERLLNK